MKQGKYCFHAVFNAMIGLHNITEHFKIASMYISICINQSADICKQWINSCGLLLWSRQSRSGQDCECVIIVRKNKLY